MVYNSAVCLQITDEARAEQKETCPAPKCGRTLGASKRRVTFHPQVQERSLPPRGEAVTLKEAANVVVHYLDPYYSQGKFANKVGIAL